MKATLWLNQSTTWVCNLTVPRAFSPGCDMCWSSSWSLFSLSPCTQLLEHIERIRPCVRYFLHITMCRPHATPKGSYILLSWHVIDEVSEFQERSFLFQFLCLACVWTVSSRVLSFIVKPFCPSLILQNGLSGFKEFKGGYFKGNVVIELSSTCLWLFYGSSGFFLVHSQNTG